MEHLPDEIFEQYFPMADSELNLDCVDSQVLYLWNKRISAALWEVLCDIESALRCSIDKELTILNVTESNRESWVEQVETLIGKDGFRYVVRAKSFLQFREIEITHASVISELNFSFWCSLLSKRYKDTLWRTALRYAFLYLPSRQPEYIFTRVRHLHLLRNRIAHHEPIHQRDIAGDFQICLEVLNAISPTIAAWSTENSRVLQVLAEKPISSRD